MYSFISMGTGRKRERQQTFQGNRNDRGTCVSKFPDKDASLAQFNTLMRELLQGGTHRGKFRPWEIDILLDIESCKHCSSAKTLFEYQNAVQAELEKGACLPLRFSEYMERQETNRTRRKPAKGASRTVANLRLNIA